MGLQASGLEGLEFRLKRCLRYTWRPSLCKNDFHDDSFRLLPVCPGGIKMLAAVPGFALLGASGRREGQLLQPLSHQRVTASCE